MFLSFFWSHSFCLQSQASLHFISNPSWGNWFVGVGERQIAAPLNLKLASLIYSVCDSTQSKKGLQAYVFLFFLHFSLLRKRNIDSSERALWWDSKKKHYLNVSPNKMRAKGVKTCLIQPEHWSNFIASWERLYYIQFVFRSFLLDMLLLSSPHTHFPTQEGYWDLKRWIQTVVLRGSMKYLMCVCVCAWVCVYWCVGVWQGEGARAGAITWGVVENMRAAKYNNCRSPGITG